MSQTEPSLLDSQVAPEKPRSNRKKFIVAFVAIILFTLALLVLSNLYAYWRALTSTERYNQGVSETAAADLAAKMADTYGGKSPAETLSMYIDAVKKGDYELASKYFVEKNRAQSLEFLKTRTKSDLDKFLNNLNATESAISTGSGGYSVDRKEFGTTAPFGTDFVLYPNEIWKIIEI